MQTTRTNIIRLSFIIINYETRIFQKPLIFGGLDGILTSFAIVAGASGGNMDVTVVLVLGFSNIFADGKFVLRRIR